MEEGGGGDYETTVEDRKLYEEETRNGEARIRKYPKAELEKVLSNFGLATVKELFNELDSVAKSGRGQFFKL